MPTKTTKKPRVITRTTKKSTSSSKRIKRKATSKIPLTPATTLQPKEGTTPTVLPVSQESAVLRKKSYLYAVGRRKSAVARVRLYVDKQSEITVNERSAAQYFHNFYLEKIVSDPLRATELLGKVGLSIKVSGGGPRGQAESIRHGIARVLTSWQKEFRAPLKQAGFLRRDPRVKERKKYGLKRARRAPQWSKR